MNTTVVFIHGRNPTFNEAEFRESLEKLKKIYKEYDLNYIVVYYADILVNKIKFQENLNYFEDNEILLELITNQYHKNNKKKLFPLNYLRDFLDNMPYISKVSLYLFLSDVNTYFCNKKIRTKIIDKVGKKIQGLEKYFIFAHSLGSIIAYDLLNSKSIYCPLLITAGSPLGLKKTINSKLLNDKEGEKNYPKKLKKWINIYDKNDIIATYPLGKIFKTNEGKEVLDILVHTDPSDRHGIFKYYQALLRSKILKS